MSMLFEGVKIKKALGERQVLSEVNLTLSAGEKVGIVGCNGAGKSTLLKIIMGELPSDDGQLIWHKKERRIAHLMQITEQQVQDTLSGGERTKALLRKVFYEQADLWLLDEPTNHLDREGINWLIGMVKSFKGAVLVVSHDRYFLDQCVTRIVEIEHGRSISYPGNYSAYRRQKQEAFDAQLHAYTQQEKRKKQLEEKMAVLEKWSSEAHRDARKKAVASGNKFGGKEHNRAKAKKMDQRIHSQLKRLEKMKKDGLKCPEKEQKIFFSLNPDEKKGLRVISAQGLSKSYSGKRLFGPSGFYILRGEKVGIYGCNGCGKTTLLKILLGQEQAEGNWYVSPGRKVGYMCQEVLDLPAEKTIREIIDWQNKEQEIRLRSRLEQMGFQDDMLQRQAGQLSMGERMKIKMLMMMEQGCDLLIMDEPNNHIDLHVREQLEEVLASYEGTLLLVTHDAYMMNKVCDKLLVFEDKKIMRFEGSLIDYEAKKRENKAPSKKQKNDSMLRAFRLTYLIGALSQTKKETPEYKALEAEYDKLLAQQ